MIEVVWFDPGRLGTITHQCVFEAASGAAPDEPPRERVRHALSHGPLSAAPSLEAALYTAEAESPPAPAVVLVGGTLELELDELELLQATTLAAAPLAGSDRRLKEALDIAAEVLRTPVPALPEVLEAIRARVRDAWARANQRPADHLAASAERMVLEQRRYQARELMGESWFRGLLGGPGWETPLPVYVPQSSVKSLPIYRRFPARVIGEVVWQQDPFEAHPLALRALAIGRLPSRMKPRARRGSLAAIS